MDINASLFPAEVKATGDERTMTSYKVDLRMDNSVIVHLKLEQAYSLWHELGAVLQSLDHDDDKAAAIANLEDLRGLPHSSDLESHPSNSRR